MNQLSLFEFRPHRLARTTDPATSKLAAAHCERIRSDHARAIVEVLRESSEPLAAEQIAQRLASHKSYGLSPVQVCRRLKELERHGTIEATGELHRNDTGRLARKYRLKGGCDEA